MEKTKIFKVISIALACFSASAHASDQLDPEIKAIADKNPPYWQYEGTDSRVTGEVTADSDRSAKPKAIEVLADPVVPQPAAAAAPAAPAQKPISYDTSSDLLQNADHRSTITPARTRAASFDWSASESDAESLVGDDGSVQYAYGGSMPIVSCAPLHLSVIKLQADETVTNISIGDSVRWKAQAATAGKYPVVVVKPTVVNIKTNLTIMTSAGRIYYVTLVSYPNRWVPLISFYDPQKIVETVTSQQQIDSEKAASEAKRKDEDTVAMIPGDMTSLDFNYTVSVEHNFFSGTTDGIKPARVFSSAGHTYIQMPDSLKYKDAPAIFSVINNEQQLVNYKTKGAYYIVDGVPDRMNLVLGAGKSAKTVVIQHKQ